MTEAVLTLKEINSLKVQFLFVTANKFESAEIKQRLKPLQNNAITTYSSNTIDITLGYLGSYLIAHIHLPQQGAQKPYAATLCIDEAYRIINPLCVIMVGVAFGNDKNTQKIGDILLSRKIQPYGSVRRSTGETGGLVTENRNEATNPGYTIMRFAQKFADWINHVPLRYKVHVGTILAGEELIDNESYKNNLISAFSTNMENVVGGEMESQGLTSVMIHKENMNWIVVKGICDWADGNKGENKSERQQLAACNAVDFCVRFLNTDNLSKLPNFKKTKLNYKQEYNVYKINGYKMFYARNKYCCSIKQLAKKTKITEAELRKLEDFTIVDGNPVFLSIKQKKAKKIQEALKCGNELFENAFTEQEKFFFGNKKMHGLCPPDRAKAVVFDFDGTLTIKDHTQSTWQKIWDYLGYDPKICESLHRKYVNGDLTHQEWCEITAEYFISKNLAKDQIISIAEQIALMPGTKEVLQVLNEYHIPVYICSGSIDIIIESVLGELTGLVKKIVANQFAYDTSGTRLKTIIGTVYDFEGKSEFIKTIAKDLGIDASDIVFVGNSNNDEFAFKSGAKTLVINPKLTSGYNRGIWRYFAGQNVTNLCDILPFLLPDKYLLKEFESTTPSNLSAVL